MAGRKAKRLLALTAAIAGVLSIEAGKTFAQTQYWDSDPGTSGDQYGNGTWDVGSTPDWLDSGFTIQQTWTNGSAAVFGGTIGGSYAALGNTGYQGALITLGTNISASSITFNAPYYEFVGGTSTSTSLYGLSVNQVNLNGDVSIGAPITATGFTTTGTGVLSIGGLTNFITGNITVGQGGTLGISGAAALGSGNVILDGGQLNLGSQMTLATNSISVTTNGGVIGVFSGQRSYETQTFIGGANVLLGGAGATLTKVGYGTLNIFGPQNLQGTLVMANDSGLINVEGSVNGQAAALTNNNLTIVVGVDDTFGVDNFDTQAVIGNNNLYPGPANGGPASANRIADGIQFVMNGGSLSYTAANSAANTENFGTVTLTSGWNRFNVFVEGSGGKMVVNNLVVDQGSELFLSASNFGLPAGGNIPYFVISNLTINGVTTATPVGFLGGWAGMNNDFAYNAGGTIGIQAYGQTGTPAYAAALGAGNVSTFTGAVAVPSGTANLVGAIRLTGTTAANTAITFANGTSVLDIQGGAIMYNGNGAITSSIGTAAIPGVITVGGGTSTAFQANTLYIKENSSGTINIFSKIVDNGTNSVALALDNYNVSSSTTVLENQTNSYTGGTYLMRSDANATYETYLLELPGVLSTGNVFSSNAWADYGTGAHVGSGTNAIFITNDSVLQVGNNGTVVTDVPLTNPGDRFYVDSTSYMSFSPTGSTFQTNAISSLTRVSDLNSTTNGGTVEFQPGASLRILNSLVYELNNLTPALIAKGWGTNADIYVDPWAIVTTDVGYLAVGQGTPWKGLDADASGSGQFIGTITASSNFYLTGTPINLASPQGRSMIIGSGSFPGAGSIGVINTSTNSISAFVNGTVFLEADLPNMSNNITWDVQAGGLFIPRFTGSFGTSTTAGTAGLNATTVVESGGTLEMEFNTDSLNGNVFIEPGGAFEDIVADFTGIGTITFEPGSKGYIFTSGMFTGSQPIVADPGVIWELNTGQITNISNVSFVGNSSYLQVDANIGLTNQSNPETVNLGTLNAVLTNNYTNQMLAPGNAPIIVSTGTIAATTGTVFGIENYLDFGSSTYTFNAPPASVNAFTKNGGIVGIFAPFVQYGTSGATFTLNGQAVGLGYSLNGLTQQSVPHNTSFVTTNNGGDLVMTFPETEVIASVTGNGVVSAGNELSTTAGTLDVGYGDVSSTFAGTFNNSYGLAPNITKIGNGVLNLTGGNATNGTAGILTVASGTVDISGAGNVGFATDVVAVGGTLTLDDSGTTTSNRLGVGNTLAMAGGTLNVIGGSGNAVDAIGILTDSVTSGGGASVINYTAGSGSVVFNVTTVAGISNTPTASILINGNVGGAASNSGGAFNIYAATPNLQNGSPTNTGTTYTGVRPDIIINNGGTLTFATYDSTFGLRALSNSEMASYNLSTIQGNLAPTGGNTSDNLIYGTSQNITGDAITMSLTLNSGANITGVGAGSNVRLGVRSGGILVQNGNSTISTPWIDTYGSSDLMLYTAGNLTINSTITDAYGIEKSGTGTLSFGSGALSAMSGALAINQGATILGANNSVPFDFWATGRAFFIGGGSLDLGGNSEVMNGLTSNAYPGAGGLLTNSSTAGAVVTLAAGSTFGGTIGGNIELDLTKGTVVLTAPQTYVGNTYVRAGTLTLRDSGSITNSNGIIVQGNSTLLIENNQSISDLPNRTGNVPISMNSGTLQVDGGAGAVATGATFNTVNINAGQATVDSRAADYSTNTITINNLNVNANGVVNFSGNANTLQLGLSPTGGGTFNTATPLIQIGNMNGTSLATYFGPLGGSLIVNDNDFAGYNGTSSGGYGVGAMGQGGFPSYAFGPSAGQYYSFSSSYNAVGGSEVGALKMAGVASIVFGANTDVLDIDTGGLLGDNTNSFRNIGSTVAGGVRGILTAGGTTPSGPASIYASFNAGTNIIESVIADNTNGAAVTLVKALGGTLTLANVNSLTGGIIVEGGTLALGATNATNTSVTASVPGNLTIIGTGVVTETVAKQFSPTSTITFNEGGSVNILQGSSETITSVTFDGGNGGGPGINIGTNASTTTLTLSGSNAVTVTADNASDMGHINNGELTFTATNPIINISGTAILGLNIGATINSAHEIVKTGTGGLVLAPGSASSAWTSGLDIQQGLVAINNISAINSGNFYQVDTGAELATEATGASVGTVILNGGTLVGGGIAANATNTIGTLNVTSNGGTVQLYNGANPSAANSLSTSITMFGGLTGGTNAVLTLVGPTLANLGGTLVVTNSNGSTYSGLIKVEQEAQLQLKGTGGLPNMAATIELDGGSQAGIPDSYGTNLSSYLQLRDNSAATYNDSVTMTGTYVNISADHATSGTGLTLGLAQVTIGNQYVTATSADSYNLAFNNAILTGTGTATLNVVADTLTLGNATTTVSTGTLVKAGAGTLTLTNPNSFSLGNFTINTGVVNVNGGNMSTAAMVNNSTFNVGGGTASLGVVTGSGAMTLSPTSGTSLTTVTSIVQSAVTVNAGAYLGVASNGIMQGTNTVTSLTISGNGQLDLGNNSLVTTTPSNTIRQYLIAGANIVGTNPAAWNGTGGISSVNAAASTNHLTALGYSTGTHSALGIALGLNSGQTVVKYTIMGDANLDGSVDISDLDIVLSNYASGKPPTWDTGDFTYAGQTDITDLNIVLSNYAKSAPATVATPSVARPSVKAASGPQTLTGTVSPAVASGAIELDVNTITGDAVLNPNNVKVVSLQVASSSGNLIPNNWQDLSFYYGTTHWADSSFQTINLAEYDTAYTSRHDSLLLTAPVDYGDIFNTSGPHDLTFEYGIPDADGSDVDTEVGVVVYSSGVPEPTTLGLMGLAMAGLIGRRRRKNRSTDSTQD